MIRVNTTEYETLYALTDETPIRIGVIIPDGAESDVLLEEITDNIGAIELDGTYLSVGKLVSSNHVPEYPFDITERANVLEIYLADADYQDPEEIAEIKQSEWDAVAAKQEETDQAIAEAAEQQEANKTDLELALAEAVEKQTVTEQALADEVAAHEETKKALSDVQAQQDTDKTNLELAIAELTETVCSFQETSAVDTTDIAPVEPAEGAEA